MENKTDLKRTLGLYSGILFIVADMIGTGVFMNTGNILGMTHNAGLVMLLWVIGGLVAVTGALSYAELSSTWPEVGGEYVYLKKSFGLLPAFLTGWISLVVGFSAPVATSSLLLVQYVNRFQHSLAASPESLTALDAVLTQKLIAALIIVFFGLMHIYGVKKGSYLQNALTVIKLIVVVSLIVAGFLFVDYNQTGRLFAEYHPAGTADAFSLPVTGLALLIIMFAFSGWNCASYIAGEMKEPERTLPKALLWGTILTTVIYLALNSVFLLSAPGEAIMGKDEIGAIATQHLFGPGISGMFTLGIALLLLSAVSVQTMVGPRVYFAMAKDNMIFSSLAKIHGRFGTPYIAILVQMLLSVIYVFTGSAMTLVIYMGFALNIFPVLSVIGLIYMRKKYPERARPYKVPLYPIVPLMYITLTIAMMAAALMNWTKTSLFAMGVVVLGIPVYFIWKYFFSKKSGV
jgi:basic amino acid/polyamine antiporter, APA family